jgi:hypothetical protein
MKEEESMPQETPGAISLKTRVVVGQLIVALKPQIRCLVCNMTLEHYQEQTVEAVLLLLDEEQGQPLSELLPLLPASLADGELCRVVWREQTIAFSVHYSLDEELIFLQSLMAVRHWIMAHPELHTLVVAQEAREAVTLVDPLRLAQLRHSSNEEGEGQ